MKKFESVFKNIVIFVTVLLLIQTSAVTVPAAVILITTVNVPDV